MDKSMSTITWRFCDAATVYPDVPTPAEALTIRTPEDVFKHFRSLFAAQVRERFVTFWLAASNSVIGFEVISEGTLNSSLVHPREVFRGAIVATCASIIVAHNHPSGNPEPSAEDLAITRQLLEAGRIVGIPMHDHIIFTDHSFTSLAERGLL